MNDDPAPELYAILDEAKLTGGHLLNSKRGMTSLITEIRGDIVGKVAAYIKRREDELKKENRS